MLVGISMGEWEATMATGRTVRRARCGLVQTLGFTVAIAPAALRANGDIDLEFQPVTQVVSVGDQVPPGFGSGATKETTKVWSKTTATATTPATCKETTTLRGA